MVGLQGKGRHVRGAASSVLLLSVCNGEVQLELCGELVFRVETIAEVHTADAAVGVNLNSQGLDVVCAVPALAVQCNREAVRAAFGRRVRAKR
jgi:hypothetical protein